MNAFTQPGDVVEITVLKSQPDSDKALEILRKIASKVKPIMKKHGWVLPTLAEFFPKNPNLLGININRGKKICIRLRPASDPYSFLPLEEELIGTMLHELTHNHRGPHDEIFNKFLDRLWEEYDALSAKGYTGEGFLGVGRRVGEGIGHDSGLSLREAREKALKSFEEKERVRKVLGVGGRLGGKEVETKGRRLGDILADAAERRSKATKGCGGDDAHDHSSGSAQTDLPQEVQDEIEKADKDSRRVVIDLTQEEDSDGEADEEFGNKELPTRRKGDRREFEEDRKPDLRREESPDLIIVSDSSNSASSKPLPPRTSSRTGQKRSGQTSPPASKRRSIPSSSSSSSSQQPQRGWTCPICTYHNLSSSHLSCSICLSERPASTLPSSSSSSKRPPSSLPERMTLKSITGTTKEVVMKSRKEEEERWTCHVCAKRVEKVFWCCTDCGTVKLRS